MYMELIPEKFLLVIPLEIIALRVSDPWSWLFNVP